MLRDGDLSKQTTWTAASWAAFRRSQETSTARANRTNKMPAEIGRIINASNQRHYFNLWMNCDKDWGRVVLYEKSRTASCLAQRASTAHRFECSNSSRVSTAENYFL